jgi:hypothetical protein
MRYRQTWLLLVCVTVLAMATGVCCSCTARKTDGAAGGQPRAVEGAGPRAVTGEAQQVRLLLESSALGAALAGHGQTRRSVLGAYTYLDGLGLIDRNAVSIRESTGKEWISIGPVILASLARRNAGEIAAAIEGYPRYAWRDSQFAVNVREPTDDERPAKRPGTSKTATGNSGAGQPTLEAIVKASKLGASLAGEWGESIRCAFFYLFWLGPISDKVHDPEQTTAEAWRASGQKLLPVLIHMDPRVIAKAIEGYPEFLYTWSP